MTSFPKDVIFKTQRKTMNTDYHIPLYKDELYHIYNRGNGKEKIFYSHENYLFFLRQYQTYLTDVVDTFAFCLLPNHFHILARISNNDSELISKRFREFFISYSMAINKQENRKGNLFQRAFKRKVIKDEKYFYSAVYYIHANPVHHNIFKDLRHYKYSSYKLLAGNKETKICRDEVIAWFGGVKNFLDFHSVLASRSFDEEFMIEGD